MYYFLKHYATPSSVFCMHKCYASNALQEYRERTRKFWKKIISIYHKKPQMHISWWLCVTASLMNRHTLCNISFHMTCCTTSSVQALNLWYFLFGSFVFTGIVFLHCPIEQWSHTRVITDNCQTINQSRFCWRLHRQ